MFARHRKPVCLILVAALLSSASTAAAQQARALSGGFDDMTIPAPMVKPLPGQAKAQPQPSPAPVAPAPLPAPALAQPQRPAPVGQVVDMTSEAIREVQQLLYNHNFQITKIDGQMSEELRREIRAAQRVLNEPDTGLLTVGQLERIRRAPQPTVWGAAAYGPRGTGAVISNASDRKTAETTVLERCKKSSGANCTVLTVTKDWCVAITYATGQVGNTVHHDTASGRAQDPQATRERALDSCRGFSKVGAKCAVKYEACADGRTVANPSAPPAKTAKGG